MIVARGVAIAVIAMLPLVCWPGLAQPFSTPKLWMLVGAVVLLAPFAGVARITRIAAAAHAGGIADQRGERGANAPSFLADHWLPLLWIAAWSWSALLGDVVSLDAVLLACSTALFAIVLNELDVSTTHIVRALIAGATGVAIVALLQWGGYDPFALAGWIAPIDGASARLRIYGTLGNPNFVAALLAATLPLTVSQIAPRERASLAFRVLFVDALILQLAALAATGSRAGALGVIVATLTWIAYAIAHRTRTARPRGSAMTWVAAAALAALVAAAALVAFSPARPLGDTIAGRLYIWHSVWPHAFDAPIAGQGPGAFELRHPAWEREALQRHAGATSVFSGPQQHAHNDYLESLIDRGLPGPVTILVILTTCFRRSWRRLHGLDRRDGLDRPDASNAPASSTLVGAAAALAALGAIAGIDFPLARPAETMLWWSVSALLYPVRRRP